MCCAEKKSFAFPNAGNGNGAFFWRGGGEIFPCTVMQLGHTTALWLWRRRKGGGGGKRRNLNRSLDGWKRQNVCSQVAAKEAAAAGGEEEDGFGSIG